MAKPRVLGLSGSLREPSFSFSALSLAAEGARAAGADVQLLGGRELAFPNFDPQTAYDDPPDAAAAFVELCRDASGFIWVSPAYHGTISGLFKNALDYLDLLRGAQAPFLTGKPVGVVSVGSGTIAVVNAANTMVYAAHALRAHPLPIIVPVGLADSVFSPEGACRDAALRQRLLMLGAEVGRNAVRFEQERAQAAERTG